MAIFELAKLDWHKSAGGNIQ